VIYRGKGVTAEIGLVTQVPTLSSAQDLSKVAGAGRYLMEQFEEPEDAPADILEVMIEIADPKGGNLDNFPVLRSLAVDTQTKIKNLNEIMNKIEEMSESGNHPEIETNLYWQKFEQAVIFSITALNERWISSFRAKSKIPLEEHLGEFGIPKALFNRIVGLRPQDLPTIEPQNLLFKNDVKEWPRLLLTEIYDSRHLRSYLLFLSGIVDSELITEIFGMRQQAASVWLGMNHLSDNHQDVVSRMSVEGAILAPIGLTMRNTLVPPGLPQMPCTHPLDELNIRTMKRVGLNLPLNKKHENKVLLIERVTQTHKELVTQTMSTLRIESDDLKIPENANRVAAQLTKEGVFQLHERGKMVTNEPLIQWRKPDDNEAYYFQAALERHAADLKPPGIPKEEGERVEKPKVTPITELLVMGKSKRDSPLNRKFISDLRKTHLEAFETVQKRAKANPKGKNKVAEEKSNRGNRTYYSLSRETNDVLKDIFSYGRTKPYRSKITAYLVSIANPQLQVMAARNMLGHLQVSQGIGVTTVSGSFEDDLSDNENDPLEESLF